MTYQAREPNTPMRRWQERCEETYARQDRDHVWDRFWEEVDERIEEWKRNRNTTLDNQPSKAPTFGDTQESDSVPQATSPRQ